MAAANQFAAGSQAPARTRILVDSKQAKPRGSQLASVCVSACLFLVCMHVCFLASYVGLDSQTWVQRQGSEIAGVLHNSYVYEPQT